MAMYHLKTRVTATIMKITTLKTSLHSHPRHLPLPLLPLQLPSHHQLQLPSHHQLQHPNHPQLQLQPLLPANLPLPRDETPTPTNPIFGTDPPNLLSKRPPRPPIPEILPFSRAIEPPERLRIPPIMIILAAILAATIPAKNPRPIFRNARIRAIFPPRWTKRPPCSIRIPPVPRGSAVLRSL